MNYTLKIRNALLDRKGIFVNKAIAAGDVRAFIDRFRAHYVATDLIRIGGDGDGGYLVPDMLDGVSHCFSPGVSHTANFEQDLSDRYGIRSFLADASVAGPPIENPNFSFIPKFLGSYTAGSFITLGDWMAERLDGSEGDMILQMDIEGGEFDVLTIEDAETLARFSVAVVEFHDMERLFDRHFLRTVSAMFEKLYLNFSICHVHPNNCCGIKTINGVEIPRVFEVTFLRNDHVPRLRRDGCPTLPHPLDRRNVATKDDIEMPRIWWQG